MALKATLRAICPPVLWGLGRRAKKSMLAYSPIRNTWFAYRDLHDRLTGKFDPLVPPRALQYAVGWGFHDVGVASMRHLVELAELQPSDRILEVGSGCGRVAVPLTRFLNDQGRYDGFDVMRNCVNWCQKAITPRFPHFRFHWADVQNPFFNPRGQTSIEQYRFPYRDGEFDLVFLTSVLTHLLPTDCDRYLAEIARMIRRGGRCLATFFLMNSYSRAMVENGFGSFRFRCHTEGGYWTTHPHLPEEAIAFPESWVHERLAYHGLSMERIEYGSWCGRPNAYSGQDVLVLRKWR